MTFLAKMCLLPKSQIRMVALSNEYFAIDPRKKQAVEASGWGLWALGLSTFLNASETPKMRSAAIHLLTNLAYKMLPNSTECILPIHLVTNSSLAGGLISHAASGDSIEQQRFLNFLTKVFTFSDDLKVTTDYNFLLIARWLVSCG